MENIHIKNFIGKHVHFIGIGGISMSGIAEILLNKGYKVSGSDIRNSAIIERLRKKGANIYIGHRPSNINGANLVVYTAAINKENPELLEAHKNSIPTMDRATLLGQLMETYPFAIGVSGTHGKTTTTSMLSIIMEHADLDPTILVGGEVDEIGGNVRTGTSDYFLTEACEYVESFLKFHPYIALILNID
ncbi:MAG TPA: UDP-N-acetylmuramate--L-alanine ligase, partial [Clostridiales bacterium]|nr:UDP-N-acetylmuramate--L-alanine ligase [Clostridiales bacterium]